MSNERPFDESSTLRAAPHVHTRDFNGELVLLHFGRGEYFGLDAAGALVWRQCMAGATLSEAAARLAETFEIPHEQALADVLALANELRRADLVTT